MKSLDALIGTAMELKKKGLTEKEIGDEIHLSTDTVAWLLSRGVGGDKTPPADVKIGWRSVGVYSKRIAMISAIFGDIALEEMERRDFEVDTVAGIAINGIPFATMLSDELDVEFAIYRPQPDGKTCGTFSSNYANLDGKKVILVDDVISSGTTIEYAIRDLQECGATPVLILVLVNKTAKDDIQGVPLRALVRARTI